MSGLEILANGLAKANVDRIAELERENAELKIIAESANITCEEQRKFIASQNMLVEQMADALGDAAGVLPIGYKGLEKVMAALEAAKGGKRW